MRGSIVILMAHNLTRWHGSSLALSDVSLTAAPGVLAILGPNGAGKSTLMRILATVDHPYSGSLQFGPYVYETEIRTIRRCLGYLPQELDLPAHLTPRKLLRYLMHLKGLVDREQPAILLRELGVDHLADQPIGRLSGGEVRRIGIAQTLLGNPGLLVLDEPTSGLDVQERARVMRLLGRPNSGQVIIISTHLPSEVEAFASQVLVLSHGHVRFAGPSEALRRLAEGQVHETCVPVEQLDAFVRKALVSRVASGGSRARIRVVGAVPTGVAVDAVPPTLEDAYLLLTSDHAPYPV